MFCNFEQRETPTRFLSVWVPDLEKKDKIPKNRVELNLKKIIYTFQLRLRGKFDNSFSGNLINFLNSQIYKLYFDIRFRVSDM